jgi:hypothetical protein
MVPYARIELHFLWYNDYYVRINKDGLISDWEVAEGLWSHAFKQVE